MNVPIPKKRSNQAVEPCAGSLPAVICNNNKNNNEFEEENKGDEIKINRIAPWPLEEQANPN